MTHGARSLRFSCTGCGNCCRDYRVALTAADVGRLGLQSLTHAVEWLRAEQVDMVGEPGSFVVLPEGRRLLALKHVNGGCIFLNENRCTVYDKRPRSCRLFPFDVTLGRRSGVRRLRLLGQQRCEAEWAEALPPQRLASEKRAELRELAAYLRVVSQFNRLQKQRQRLGKRLLDAKVFFERLGPKTSASNAGASRAIPRSDS